MFFFSTTNETRGLNGNYIVPKKLLFSTLNTLGKCDTCITFLGVIYFEKNKKKRFFLVQ